MPPVTRVDVSRLFHDTFGRPSEFSVLSPGRVNLIGDHIDYCGGLVMPMAIDRGTRIAVAANDTSLVRVYSSRFGEVARFDLAQIDEAPRGHWIDYAIGIAREMGVSRGIDVYAVDEISGGGLSSSASFTVGLGYALGIANGQTFQSTDELLRLALASQAAENHFVGVSCGIMDQVSVALGGVLKLDCASVTAEPVRGSFGRCRIVVMNTGVERKLAASAYNQRVQELDRLCDELGLSRARLCQSVLSAELPALEGRLDKLLFSRLRHVVTEHDRVQRAAVAMLGSDLATLGRLMTQSHASLRRDYGVSGEGLDFMVALSLEEEGVLGARMTGAGFGGCAIALVESDAIPGLIDKVSVEYQRKTGIVPQLFSVAAARGVGYSSE